MSKEEKFLYLEGLAKFQAGPDGDIKDPLSYYQIAGKFTSPSIQCSTVPDTRCR